MQILIYRPPLHLECPSFIYEDFLITLHSKRVIAKAV